MYCNNCGKHNPKDSKFCQHCGKKFDENSSATEIHTEADSHNTNEHNVDNKLISQHTTPYPYVISLWKFFILSTFTFGVFDIYWFYRQWKSFYAVKNQKHGGFYISLAALFAGFSSFSLFGIIAKEVKEINPRKNLEAVGLAITFLVLNALYKLPDPYWLLSSLSIFALLPVQASINYYWDKKYGDKVIRSGFGVWNFIVAFIGIIFVSLALIGTFNSNSSSTTTSAQTNSTNTPSNTYNNSISGTSVSPTPIIDNFKTQYQTQFVKSCQEGASGNADYCTCVANYMITNYTDDQLIQITKDYQSTNQTPQELNDAINSCTSTSPSVSPSGQ